MLKYRLQFLFQNTLFHASLDAFTKSTNHLDDGLKDCYYFLWQKETFYRKPIAENAILDIARFVVEHFP